MSCIHPWFNNQLEIFLSTFELFCPFGLSGGASSNQGLAEWRSLMWKFGSQTKVKIDVLM